MRQREDTEVPTSNTSIIMLLTRLRSLELLSHVLEDERWLPIGYAQDLKAAYEQCSQAGSTLSLSTTMARNPIT